MANKRSPGLSPIVPGKKFGAGMTTRNYRDKEIVFSQGDTADAVFYIQSGPVKLTAVSTRRKKAIIAFLQRGSFFGEGCLGGQPLRICMARVAAAVWANNQGIKAGVPAEGEPVNLGGNGWYHPGQGK